MARVVQIGRRELAFCRTECEMRFPQASRHRAYMTGMGLPVRTEADNVVQVRRRELVQPMDNFDDEPGKGYWRAVHADVALLKITKRFDKSRDRDGLVVQWDQPISTGHIKLGEITGLADTIK